MPSLSSGVSLEQHYYRILEGGQAELSFTCSLQPGDDDETALPVTIFHQYADGQEVLHEGTIAPNEPLTITALLDHSKAIHGRIVAVLRGNPNGVAGLDYHPVVKSPRDQRFAFEPPPPSPPRRPSRPLKWGPSFEQDEDFDREDLAPAEDTPSAPSPSSRPAFRLTPLQTPAPQVPERDRRRRREPVRAPQRERARVFVQRVKKPSRTAQVGRWMWRRLKSIASGPIMALITMASVASGWMIKKGYDQGVEDAALVARYAPLLPHLPLLTPNKEGGLVPLTYISSKPFIPQTLAQLDRDTTVNHTYNSSLNYMPTQADELQDLRPIFPKDVQPGGPLYLTRQALTVLEDDWAEKNYGINLPGIGGAILDHFHGGKRGGSSLHDQLCGQVWAQTGSVPGTPPPPLARKRREVFCGIGLGFGGQMTIDEVFAYYMTYVSVGGKGRDVGMRSIIEKYWGIHDLSDPRLTRGRKLVLAALPKHRLPHRQGGIQNLATNQADIDAYWNRDHGNAKARAATMLDLLIESEDLSLEERSALLRDRETILQEIRDAKPDLNDYQRNHLDQKPYDFVGVLAGEELKAYIDSQHIDREQWRAEHDGLKISIDPDLHAALPPILTVALQPRTDITRGTVLIINEHGEYVAIATGSKDGFDGQATSRRIKEQLYPGSLGKLMIAADFASHLYSTADTDPNVRQATQDIQWSRRSLIDHAPRLHVRGEDIRERIECFGTYRQNLRISPIEVVVKGNWDVRPVDIARYLTPILSGQPLPSPHLVLGDVREGVFSPWVFPLEADAERCAMLMHQSGRTLEWAELPLRGTMSAIAIPDNALHVIGKTGTANASLPGGVASRAATTTIAWAPFSVQFKDGSIYTVVDYIHAETVDSQGRGISPNVFADIGSHLTSSEITVPLSNDVLDLLSQSVRP